jgi:DivIVA domain-containing protein
MTAATADEIRNERFSTTRFVTGYELNEVDAFLDDVVKTLEAYETGTPLRTPLRSSEVAEHTFALVHLREGYKPAEVSTALENIAATLRRWEQHDGHMDDTVTPELPVFSASSSKKDTKKNVQYPNPFS